MLGLLQYRWSCPSRAIVALVLLLALVASGCGPEAPFEYVQVKGKITYEDGEPIPGLKVYFVPLTPPVDNKTHARWGVADEVKPDGTIEIVTSYKFGDGIARGKHKVLVVGHDEEGSPIGSVGPEYGDPETTPLEIDTEDGEFELFVKRPESKS